MAKKKPPQNVDTQPAQPPDVTPRATGTTDGADCGDPSGQPRMPNAESDDDAGGAQGSAAQPDVDDEAVKKATASGTPRQPASRPKRITLSAEIARLARDAFGRKDFAAHGELHQVEMAIAHLRQAMSTAVQRLTGESREFLEQLLQSL